MLAPLARSRLRATGVCGHWMPLNISQCPQDKVNWWLRQNSALRAVMLRCPNSWSTNFCLFVLCTHFPSHFKAILCWQKVPCWQLWMTQELNASPRTGRAAGCIASLLAPTTHPGGGTGFCPPWVSPEELVHVAVCPGACLTATMPDRASGRARASVGSCIVRSRKVEKYPLSSNIYLHTRTKSHKY